MNIQDTLTALTVTVTLLGGSNIYTVWLLWKTRNADVKKTEALSGQEVQREVQEKANSVVKSQDILDRLTLQMEARFVDMEKTISDQGQTIITQGQTIKNLEKIVNDYKKKCESCINKKA